MRMFRTKGKAADNERQLETRHGAHRTGKDSKPPSRRKVLFEAMEPRILLSATPTVDAANVLTLLGDGAADSVEIKLVSSVPSTNGGVILNLVFDDNDADTLASDHIFGTTAVGIKGLILDGEIGRAHV